MSHHTISSPCEDLPIIKEKTVVEYVLAKAKHWAANGKSAFLIDGLSDEKRYFNSLEEQTKKVASHFYKKGLRKGDIVIYTTSHQIHQIMLMLGVWRANGVLRSLYVDESPETIFLKLQESNARWIFCDPENAADCQQIVEKCEWPVEVIVCSGGQNFGLTSFDEYFNDDGESCPELNINENDLAIILPTSGTTGVSKGAMHSHKSTLNQIRLFARLPFTHSKPNLIASKGTHVSGALLPLIMVSGGFTGIVLSKINKEIVIRTVDFYKPGFAFAFPSFLLALGGEDAKGFDVSSVEIVLTGGSPTTPEMKKAFLAISNVKHALNAYGLSEGSTVCTTADCSENGFELADLPDNSIGKPYPGGKIQIRDLETLEVLGPNQRGEICAKGDFIFVGYFQNQKDTKEAFIDGWFRTGDVGFVDENGFIFIVDRAKDIFKYYHNHISPTEIEDIIAKHRLVKEVSVVAVPDEGGEVPRAFVILKNANCKDLILAADEIKEFANGKLASYKQLKGGLYIIDDLPKGKTGKVTRNLVAKLQV